jgi:hypothetical protein
MDPVHQAPILLVSRIDIVLDVGSLLIVFESI